MVKIVVLKSAAEDFGEIKQAYRQRHTADMVQRFLAEFHKLFERMKQYPESGVLVEEARAVGANIRQHLCQQVRVIHHYDRSEDIIYVRMFLPTKKSFVEHLTNRILRP
ncbi:MAG TPA: type II toxin-antitoxin system RelE/ParE family toxin [Pseudoduganella sp.]